MGGNKYSKSQVTNKNMAFGFVSQEVHAEFGDRVQGPDTMRTWNAIVYIVGAFIALHVGIFTVDRQARRGVCR